MAARDPVETVLLQALADCQQAKAALTAEVAGLRAEVKRLREGADSGTDAAE